MTWGRYLYNPDTDPTFYHRTLAAGFGPAGPALETALAASSRILPLVTTAWLPSASNHEFWPEMLTTVQILPYTGKPALRRQSRAAQRLRHLARSTRSSSPPSASTPKTSSTTNRTPVTTAARSSPGSKPRHHIKQRTRQSPHCRRRKGPHPRVPPRRRRHPHPQRPRQLLRRALPRRDSSTPSTRRPAIPPPRSNQSPRTARPASPGLTSPRAQNHLRRRCQLRRAGLPPRQLG